MRGVLNFWNKQNLLKPTSRQEAASLTKTCVCSHNQIVTNPSYHFLILLHSTLTPASTCKHKHVLRARQVQQVQARLCTHTNTHTKHKYFHLGLKYPSIKKKKKLTNTQVCWLPNCENLFKQLWKKKQNIDPNINLHEPQEIKKKLR